jgi:hypothetical protein
VVASSSEAEPINWTVLPCLLEGAFEVNGTPSPAPAPEPSTLALAGVGLVGVVGYVWRRRKGPGPHVRGCHALDTLLGRK